MLNDPAGFYPEEPAAAPGVRALTRAPGGRGGARQAPRRRTRHSDPSLTQSDDERALREIRDQPSRAPSFREGPSAKPRRRRRGRELLRPPSRRRRRSSERRGEPPVSAASRREIAPATNATCTTSTVATSRTSAGRFEGGTTCGDVHEDQGTGRGGADGPASVRCPHVVGTDRNQWRRAPHVAVSGRGRSQYASGNIWKKFWGSIFRDREGGSVRRKVYCAECWEKMEVKRAASVVRCADCGDRFPLSKTAPFPVRRTLGSSASANGKISSTCASCAPRGGGAEAGGGPRAGGSRVIRRGGTPRMPPRTPPPRSSGRCHARIACVYCTRRSANG